MFLFSSLSKFSVTSCPYLTNDSLAKIHPSLPKHSPSHQASLAHGYCSLTCEQSRKACAMSEWTQVAPCNHLGKWPTDPHSHSWLELRALTPPSWPTATWDLSSLKMFLFTRTHLCTVCVYSYRCPQRPEEDIRSLGTGVNNLLHRLWKSNPSPLEVLLMSVPSHQPILLFFAFAFSF